MAYNIYIGNAVPVEQDGEWSVRVENATRHDAPAFPFDGMTGHSNRRSPGYTQWSDFCDAAGLSDLFFNEDAGLMREHPGCTALRPEHLAAVRAARVEWGITHPAAVPGWDWSPHAIKAEGADDGIRGRDGVMARLVWLEWWMEWALRECERPALFNS